MSPREMESMSVAVLSHADVAPSSSPSASWQSLASRSSSSSSELASVCRLPVRVVCFEAGVEARRLRQAESFHGGVGTARGDEGGGAREVYASASTAFMDVVCFLIEGGDVDGLGVEPLGFLRVNYDYCTIWLGMMGHGEAMAWVTHLLACGMLRDVYGKGGGVW